jgi:hypothetical protein
MNLKCFEQTADIPVTDSTMLVCVPKYSGNIMATDDLTTFSSESFKADNPVRAVHNAVKQKHTWKVTQQYSYPRLAKVQASGWNCDFQEVNHLTVALPEIVSKQITPWYLSPV